MNQQRGTIGPEDYQQVREVFEAALNHPAADRVGFVERACGGNARLISEVRRMLAADAETHPVLDGCGLSGQRLREGDRFANHFELVGTLGCGGMGEVYLGRDTQLNREVAIKVLSSTFTGDPDRLARFRREAQVLASLNHPNIGAIYSFEESDGIHALALEYVVGPTLADQIARGPIPLETALSIARQIAEALEAAHEKGITHRDLKPANVKITPQGVVKVLDFGLAKIAEPVTGPGNPRSSPTLTMGETEAGMIMGTAAYMAPEQARGQVVDKRADIWAFGVVLWEMLTGKQMFSGQTTSDVLAGVLKSEPDLQAVPAQVRPLLARCLERDPRQRLRDIGEARFLIESPSRSLLTQSSTPLRLPKRRFFPIAIALVAAAALAAGTALYFSEKRSPSFVRRFIIAAPPDQLLNWPTTGNLLALSPDSRNLVYVANDRLYLRPLSDFHARPVGGTEGYQSVTDPVFSPDGRWLAFYARGDQTIKRISVAGGAALTICKAEMLFGIEWAPDAIYFGQSHKGVMRVSPEGGAPEEVVHVNPGEQAHGPHLLPGGHYMLVTIARGNDYNQWNSARIVLFSLSTGERRVLIEGGRDARYIPTGHLIYGHRGNLFAIPFDLGSMKTTGSPAQVLEGVSMSGGQHTGAVQISVSHDGSMAYLPETVVSNLAPFFMGFADRSGKIERLNVPLGSLKSPRISPDGRRIAFAPNSVDMPDEPAVIWLYDVAGDKTIRRLTYAGHNRFPIWTADSSRVVFQSDRDGDLAIFWQRADGAGTAERLTRPEKGSFHVPESWSRTDDVLLYSVENGSNFTLWTLSRKTGKSMPFGGVRSVYPTDARFSPDGKWIVYASAESPGPTTISVQPFPATGAKYQLFVKGINDTPHKPAWSADGKELVYVPRFGGFEAVKVSTHPEFAFGTASQIPRSFVTGSPNTRSTYDVTPDGRFLGMFPPNGPEQFNPPREIAIVLDWFGELRAKVP